MKTHFSDRIEMFINSLGMTIREFEIDCGIANGSIGRAINNKTDLSKKSLDKIAKKHPTLSMDWLQRGEGNMLRALIEEQKKPRFLSVEWLEREVEHLRDKVKLQEQLIEELKKKK